MDQLRQQLLTNPAALQQFMTVLQQTNPQAYQAFQQNPQAFLQLILGGGAGGPGMGMGMGRRPPPGAIQVTHEEKDAIDRVHNIKFNEIYQYFNS